VKQLDGKVAVVTGAASGIGRALARRCMAAGMKVVLADIEATALTAVEVEARNAGASVLGVLTDVSDPKDVEQLAARTLSRFGAVHLLFNNAGVAEVGPALWECTVADWNWVLGVNLWGLIHGVKTFVPIMIDQGTEGHIVNTASAAGLVSPPRFGIYSASKAAVISLSETLQHELAIQRAPIRVSVVCPGLVRTRMVDSARNRPAALRNEPWVSAERREKHADAEEELRRATEEGMSADDVADRILGAVREERLYVFTHPWVKQVLELRVHNVLQGVDPWTGLGSNEREDGSDSGSGKLTE
jgi:NAD(P)-dependent dehydrogenase (short-subunit alcohol dehydrogenase family)